MNYEKNKLNDIRKIAYDLSIGSLEKLREIRKVLSIPPDVYVKETKQEGCQSEKSSFKEHVYNRFCDCLMCKENKREG